MGYSSTNAQGIHSLEELGIPSVTSKSNARENGKQSILSGSLQQILNAQNGASKRLANGSSEIENLKKVYLMSNNSVRVEMLAKSSANVDAIVKALNNIADANSIAVFENNISCMMPIANLPKLENISNIQLAKAVIMPKTNAGKVNGQGDKALRADIARAKFKVNGKGVKVGILSDSYNNQGGAAQGVKDDELPGVGNPKGFTKPVVVLKDYNFFDLEFLKKTDEGRAMAEIVHDVAPGAELYFHTAFEGEVSFASGVVKLVNAGCKVIVDDVMYFNQAAYQDGLVAKAVAYAKSKGVYYFTAAGNNSYQAYESNYKPRYLISPKGDTAKNADGSYLTIHIFKTKILPGEDSALLNRLPLYGDALASVSLTLHWDEPYVSVSGGTGAKTELRLLGYDSKYKPVDEFNATSFLNPILGGDPVQFLSFPYNVLAGNNEGFSYIGVAKVGGPDPKRIRIGINGRSQLIPIEYASSYYPNVPGVYAATIYGQPNSKEAFSVGAAPFNKTVPFGAKRDTIESFSSLGGLNILFDTTGKRINERRYKPDFVAPDGANTSFFGRQNDPSSGNNIDNDNYPNFFGTSAAAPYAAAVAALAIEASSCLPIVISPDMMRDFYKTTARDMDNPQTPGFDYGFDNRTGAGFIDAEKIVAFNNFCTSGATAYGASINAIDNNSSVSTSAISAYPNPATDKITITINDKNFDVNNASVAVIDVNGKQVISLGANAVKNNMISLNVSQLIAGTYIVKITNKNGVVKTVTFVK